jgi:5-methylcytosine-specific restriction enzyme subunit McrC
VTTARVELGRLREGQVLPRVPLTLTEATALGASRLADVVPVGDAWQVTAAYAVGALQVGDLTVRVTPKVGTVQVLRLLARAHRVRHLHLDDTAVAVGEDAGLTAVLGALFAHEGLHALAAGPIRGYRAEDQRLPFVRGRVRVREQELRRFGAVVPLEVTVDEWTADTDENRRIVAATRALLALPDLLPATRHGLRRIDRLLADVRLPPPGQPLPPWTPSRLTTRLHRLLRLADLVLARSNVEHVAGVVQVAGFVVPMERLFEDLVARLLEEEDDEVVLSRQATYRFDTGKRLTMRPDLVLRRGGVDVAVADTKYKVLDDKGRLRIDDGYQLLAYCTRLGLPVGHLVYASGNLPAEPYELEGSGVTLRIHKIDMGQPIEHIEKAVADLRETLLGGYDDAASAC